MTPITDNLAEAHRLGATGAEPTEEERLLFEEWMRGHCWALCASWNGRQYVSDAEQSGFVDPRAMNTRQMFAAWRDRAALAAYASQQADKPHLFELWWERYMPNATQTEAWEAWMAAPRADGVGVASQQAEPSSGSSEPSDARVEAGKAAALASMQEAGIYMSNGWLTEMIGAVLQAADAVSASTRSGDVSKSGGEIDRWQPIETAPKDGRLVQVWPPTYTGTLSCARWNEDKYARKPRPYWDRVDAFSTTTSRDRQPTHWMPIPAAPGPEKEAGN